MNKIISYLYVIAQYLIKICIFLIINLLANKVILIIKPNFLKSVPFFILLIFIIIEMPLVINKIKCSMKLNKSIKKYWNTIIINLLNIIIIVLLSESIYFNSFNFMANGLHEFISKDNKTIETINSNEKIGNEIGEFFKEVCKEKTYCTDKGEILYSVVAETICENTNKTKEIFYNNSNIEDFTKYKINVEEIIEYCNKYIELQKNMVFMGEYISILIFLIIIYTFSDKLFVFEKIDSELFKVNMRRLIYIIAFCIYCISFLDVNNNGLISYYIQISSKSDYSRTIIEDIMKYINVFKEAFLTFIIYDTVIECNKHIKNIYKDNSIKKENNINEKIIFSEKKAKKTINKKTVNFQDVSKEKQEKIIRCLERRLKFINYSIVEQAIIILLYILVILYKDDNIFLFFKILKNQYVINVVVIFELFNIIVCIITKFRYLLKIEEIEKEIYK